VTAKELGLNQQGIGFPEYTSLGLEKRRFDPLSSDTPKIAK
jgi:hypothetical protein